MIERAWCTKKDADLVLVELDNGEQLKCTENHMFMLRTGEYRAVAELTTGDALMPLYRRYPTGIGYMQNYRQYYEPIEDTWHYEHRQFASEVLDEKYLVQPYLVFKMRTPKNTCRITNRCTKLGGE